MTQVIPPIIIKDMGAATQKDVQQKKTTEKYSEAENPLDSHPNLGAEGLDAGGLASPQGTKRTSEPVKGP